MPLVLQEQSYVGFRVPDSTRAVGDFWLNRTFAYAGPCILNYFGRLLTLAIHTRATEGMQNSATAALEETLSRSAC